MKNLSLIFFYICSNGRERLTNQTIDQKLRNFYFDKQTVNTENICNEPEKILQYLSLVATSNKIFINNKKK